MTTIEKGLVVFIITIIITLVILINIKVKKEAEWYTKETGVKVTWSDAFFLDLDPSKHVVIIEKEETK